MLRKNESNVKEKPQFFRFAQPSASNFAVVRPQNSAMEG